MLHDGAIYFLLPFLFGAAGSFVICRLSTKWRGPLLIGWLVLPLIAYTGFLASAEPADGGFWTWWSVGLVMLLLPLSFWLLGVFVGSALKRA